MFDRTYDEIAGIIRVTASGFWTEAEVDDHSLKLRAMITELRRKSAPIRVLIDIRKAGRQSPAIERRLGEHKAATYRAGDRVAILVANSGEKDHVRTLLAGAEIWCWESEMAAEQWLFLDGRHAREVSGAA